MTGKYHLVTVKPNIDAACATAYSAADVLFDGQLLKYQEEVVYLNQYKLL